MPSSSKKKQKAREAALKAAAAPHEATNKGPVEIEAVSTTEMETERARSVNSVGASTNQEVVTVEAVGDELVDQRRAEVRALPTFEKIAGGEVMAEGITWQVTPLREGLLGASIIDEATKATVMGEKKCALIQAMSTILGSDEKNGGMDSVEALAVETGIVEVSLARFDSARHGKAGVFTWRHLEGLKEFTKRVFRPHAIMTPSTGGEYQFSMLAGDDFFPASVLNEIRTQNEIDAHFARAPDVDNNTFRYRFNMSPEVRAKVRRVRHHGDHAARRRASHVRGGVEPAQRHG